MGNIYFGGEYKVVEFVGGDGGVGFSRDSVELDGKKYRVLSIGEALREERGVRVVVEGVVKGKVVIEVKAAGWPWSISSRFIEKDHYHVTRFNLDGIQVIYFGIAPLRGDENVRVYGRIEVEEDYGRICKVIYAERIEVDNIVYTLG